jgi:hypothetical protein
MVKKLGGPQKCLKQVHLYDDNILHHLYTIATEN